MTNITLAIEDKLLKKVRSYAKRHGSTVNGLVRKNLSDLVGSEDLQEQSGPVLASDVLADLCNLADSRNTTVDALLREFVDDASDKKKQIRKSMDELYEMSLKTKARLGPDFKFDRASLYDR